MSPRRHSFQRAQAQANDQSDVFACMTAHTPAQRRSTANTGQLVGSIRFGFVDVLWPPARVACLERRHFIYSLFPTKIRYSCMPVVSNESHAAMRCLARALHFDVEGHAEHVVCSAVQSKYLVHKTGVMFMCSHLSLASCSVLASASVAPHALVSCRSRRTGCLHASSTR